LLTFADEIHDEYILSIKPASRDIGLHTIIVKVVDKTTSMNVSARKSYWLERSRPLIGTAEVAQKEGSTGLYLNPATHVHLC
jgi:hypothetical protein